MKGILLRALLPLGLCLLAASAQAADDAEAAVHASVKKHLPKAKLTLEEAIDLALKKHPDGQAVEAGFEVEAGDYDYIIEISSGGKSYEVEVDAVSGKIEDDAEVTDAEADEQAAAQAVAKSKVPLSKAIAAALEAVGGKARAFDAGPRLADGKLVFEIGLLSGKDIYDVHVDSGTGKVLAQKKAE